MSIFMFWARAGGPWAFSTPHFFVFLAIFVNVVRGRVRESLKIINMRLNGQYHKNGISVFVFSEFLQ